MERADHERGWAAQGSAAVWHGVQSVGRLLRGEMVSRVGGPARARVIVLFAAVLALSGADASTVGSVAPQLEAGLHIGNAKIGLLSSVALLTGAVFVLPVGMLVDRTKRIPMLAMSVVLWSIASLMSATAGSYQDLLLTRLALGAVNATAGPAIASLTGDYFPAAERGRIYAYILGGEIAGTAVGFIISGSVASLISWRAAFVLLALPGFFLARELWRTVPEPLRGGQSRLAPGTEDLHEAVSAAASEFQWDWPGGKQQVDDELAQVQARKRGVEPDPALVLSEDPRDMPIGRAVRYVLRVPSYLVMIVGSSLGYFFFAGLQTFAVLFVRGHYHVSQAMTEGVLAMLVVGSAIGVLVSGRLTDALLRRGRLTARVVVPGVCYVGAAGLLIPGFVSRHLTPALWFDVAGAALLSGANPPLNAARLDVMPAGLWGRAESTGSMLRSLTQALAPLTFGALASLIAGFVPAQTPVGTHPHGGITHSAATGLELTFLIMVTALAAAGLLLLRARHSYPRDVATAGAAPGWTPGGERSRKS